MINDTFAKGSLAKAERYHGVIRLLEDTASRCTGMHTSRHLQVDGNYSHATHLKRLCEKRQLFLDQCSSGA